jgi:hypothetical protein
VVKGESTSRKEFHKMTRCNRLYVLETNYWGESQSMKYLKDNRLIKNNLRIVKNFGRFYTLPKFEEMGDNLAKSILKSGELDIIKKMGIYSSSSKIVAIDIEKLYQKLIRKSQKKKSKKNKNSAKKSSSESDEKGTGTKEAGTGGDSVARAAVATKRQGIRKKAEELHLEGLEEENPPTEVCNKEPAKPPLQI